MRKLPLEEITRKVGSKYDAVIALAKQALKRNQRFMDVQLSRRSNPLIIAMSDILSDRVKIAKAEEVEEERPLPTEAEEMDEEEEEVE